MLKEDADGLTVHILISAVMLSGYESASMEYQQENSNAQLSVYVRDLLGFC